MLTGGTSEGEATPEEGSKSENSSTSGSTSKEPWTLVQKKKQGSQLKPAENTEERKRTDLPAQGGGNKDEAVTKIRTDLPAEGGATRDKAVIAVRTAQLPTYNQVTLGLRGEEEEKSSNT